jgi:hypothetical protein
LIGVGIRIKADESNLDISVSPQKINTKGISK